MGFHGHPVCPAVIRAFGDMFCLYARFGENVTEARFGFCRELQVSEWEVAWHLGGWHHDKGQRVLSKTYCWNVETGEVDDPARWADPDERADAVFEAA